MDSPTAVRRSNRSSVLDQLLTGRETDRQEIVAATGLSQATVFRVVSELLESQVVVEGPTITRAGRGRNAGSVRFNDSIALVCGIDLGGTNCRLVLSDGLGRTIMRQRFPTLHDVDARSFGIWLGDRVNELVAEHGDGIPLGAVTVGLAAAISGDKSRVVGAVNLPQIREPGFLVALRAEVDAPVEIDNDSNLALLGELRYGAVDPTETTVLLILGTGLSGAVSMRGEVLSGAQGLLGEFGRLPLQGSDLRMRDLLSGAGLAAHARSLGYRLDSTADVFARPDLYGGLVSQAQEAFEHLVGVVALAYEPATILVAGGFSEAFGADSFRRVQERLQQRVGVASGIERSRLGSDAGLLGAMGHALSSLYRGLGASPSPLSPVGAARDEVLDVFRRHTPEPLSAGV
jgi:predicted NBD/HSP70 family sugar kinase